MRSSFVMRSVFPTLQKYSLHTTMRSATVTISVPPPANTSTGMFGSVG